MKFLRKILESFFKSRGANFAGKTAFCSFCKKSYLDSGPLVEGPDRVFICYGCIQLGLKTLQADSELRGEAWPPKQTDAGSNVDRSMVDATGQQIRSMVNEIEQLSKANIPPKTFYAAFLSRIVASLAAIGGIVWMQTENGMLVPQSVLGNDEVGLDPAQLANRTPTVAKLFASGENCLIQPVNDSADSSRTMQDGLLNPTNYLLIVGLLHSGKRRIGLLEIFQRTGGRDAVERGYLRFVMQMCDIANSYNSASEP
jgi:hypothetical protein